MAEGKQAECQPAQGSPKIQRVSPPIPQNLKFDGPGKDSSVVKGGRLAFVAAEF